MRFWIILLLVLLFVASPVGATPTPPVIVVNHSTKQCAEIIQGDDCHWCEPLEGWEVLGQSSGFACPAGYENLGFQGMTGRCQGYKSQFCCSDYAHHGDCEDLIVNESEQLCGFVEEIAGCTLPEGWTSAADKTQWSGRCPFGNQWAPDVACVATTQPAQVTATTMRTTTATPLATAPPEPTAGARLPPVIVWTAAIQLGGLFAVAMLLILNRWRRR
jgi:hypothetical protein